MAKSAVYSLARALLLVTQLMVLLVGQNKELEVKSGATGRN